MKWLRRILLALLIGGAGFGFYVYYSYWYVDVAEDFPGDPVKHFKYGSTGGDRLAGKQRGEPKNHPNEPFHDEPIPGTSACRTVI